MRNWLGQKIEVGSIVYRGARDGNTSRFKIGEVTKINEGPETARVNWLVEPGIVWLNDGDIHDFPMPCPTSSGTGTVHSMVLIDPFVAEIPLGLVKLYTTIKTSNHYKIDMPVQEFKDRVNYYVQNDLGRKELYYV